MSRPLRILISAGEASGDRLGAGLATALRRLRPDVDLLGMGGPEMEAAGVRRIQDAAEVAVVGFVEVLAHLRDIRAAMRRLQDALDRERPDLLVPIDFPDFHLRLAKRARSRGVPVVYFVSPQVWAWRRGRVRVLRRLVRRMLVLFPFERAFYEEAGVPVSFVGHPVVERVDPDEPRPDLLERAGLDPGRPVVALLPGSRRSEVSRLLPPMIDAARILASGRPGLQFLVPRAGTLPAAALEAPLREAAIPGLRVHAGDFPQILTACTAGAVASGTATLEAAVAGLPAVVVYRMNRWSYALGRLLVRVDHVGMPNLVAGRRLLPELIQEECNGPAIAREVGAFLDDPERVESTRQGLREVRRRLGEPGAFERAARAILEEAARGAVLE